MIVSDHVIGPSNDLLECQRSDLYTVNYSLQKGKKVSERYYLADRTPETPSKDMVIIAKYDTESNEDRTVFIHEHGDTSLPALWD